MHPAQSQQSGYYSPSTDGEIEEQSWPKRRLCWRRDILYRQPVKRVGVMGWTSTPVLRHHTVEMLVDLSCCKRKACISQDYRRVRPTQVQRVTQKEKLLAYPEQKQRNKAASPTKHGNDNEASVTDTLRIRVRHSPQQVNEKRIYTRSQLHPSPESQKL